MMIRKRDGRVVEFAAGNGIDFECFKSLKK